MLHTGFLDFLKRKKPEGPPLSPLERKFKELESKIQKAEGEAHAAGLRGEALHSYIMKMIAKGAFRHLFREKGLADKEMEELAREINSKMHLTAQTREGVEDIELKMYNSIVEEYINIHALLHILLLSEKVDIDNFGHFIKFVAVPMKKALGPEDSKYLPWENIQKGLQLAYDSWERDLEHLRKIINSVFADSQERQNFALSLFHDLHKDGFWAKHKERKIFQHRFVLAKDLKKKEAILLKSVTWDVGMKHFVFGREKHGGKNEWLRVMDEATKEQKELAETYHALYDRIYNTWLSINNQMKKLAKIFSDAAAQNKEYVAEEEVMRRLHNFIVEKVVKTYLHEFRIDEAQIEPSLKKAQEEFYLEEQLAAKAEKEARRAA